MILQQYISRDEGAYLLRKALDAGVDFIDIPACARVPLLLRRNYEDYKTFSRK